MIHSNCIILINTDDIGGVSMFDLDLKSRIPIYEQLVEHIKEMIFQGVIQADEKMPSVRQLASELTINPNTIQKAYRELEQLGYIYSLPGKGSYVKEVSEMKTEVHVSALKEDLISILKELLFLNVSKDEIVGIIDAVEDEIEEVNEDENRSE